MTRELAFELALAERADDARTVLERIADGKIDAVQAEKAARFLALRCPIVADEATP